MTYRRRKEVMMNMLSKHAKTNKMMMPGTSSWATSNKSVCHTSPGYKVTNFS